MWKKTVLLLFISPVLRLLRSPYCFSCYQFLYLQSSISKELDLFPIFYRHWLSVGNLFSLVGLQLHMFFLVVKIWLCHVCHKHVNLRNLRTKLM